MSTKKQLFSTLLILIGGGLLLYTMISENAIVYFKIAGIVILMFGLFRATRVWVDDNKTTREDEQ
ncbi:hypothetical protein [Mesonia aestuariivivens]|uniref:Uncharacterized protein n=1 Tax=Mesonia aestuariivivens TaxID=2796128 RepID=A0ABS6W1D1_9FLAO|nr:hypothetical protein [Mesonia aestuariivivens]MBW2961352.1 hypothetical protein [Mesonia aestuariivivens]